jgi:hypothetical protein
VIGVLTMLGWPYKGMMEFGAMTRNGVWWGAGPFGGSTASRVFPGSVSGFLLRAVDGASPGLAPTGTTIGDILLVQ